eukprot:5248027-Amphidinium_carterae.1
MTAAAVVACLTTQAHAVDMKEVCADHHAQWQVETSWKQWMGIVALCIMMFILGMLSCSWWHWQSRPESRDQSAQVENEECRDQSAQVENEECRDQSTQVKNETRTIWVQSQTTYTSLRGVTNPRFLPLGDQAHGAAWCE